MKRFLLILLLNAITALAGAQNLVPNPGFEAYSTCPTFESQISLAVPWYDAKISCDYYNCSFGVPFNAYGYQAPHSGNGYAGIYSSPAAREYLGIRLLSPLEAGKTYCVQFYASLAEDSEKPVRLGALFSRDSICPQSIGSSLQQGVVSDSAIVDSVGWHFFSAYYTATGCELFMTIGNIYDTVFSATNPFVYYYIDDVSVSCCDPTGCSPPSCTPGAGLCVPPTSSEEGEFVIPNVFTPNNDVYNDLFEVPMSGIHDMECIIYDRWGKQVALLDDNQPTWNGFTANGQEASAGVYYYVLKAIGPGNIPLYRTGFIQLLR